MKKMGSLILPLTHSGTAVERNTVYSAKLADRRSSQWTSDDRAIVDGRLAHASGNNFANQAKTAYLPCHILLSSGTTAPARTSEQAE
jgi:hypothetical protein